MECSCDIKPGQLQRTRNGVCVECLGVVALPAPRKKFERLFAPVEAITNLKAAAAILVQEGGSHYKDYAIQPFEFLRRNNVPHAEGECIYKLLRWRDKGGIADLKKVIHTVQLIIEEEEKRQ